MTELIRRDIVEVLNDLPQICAARLPATNEPIMIKRGTTGYFPAAPWLDVEAFNAKRNITAAQVEAMLAGSMFGFDCPGADPLNYIAPQVDPITAVQIADEDRHG